jgi:DNA-binding transcriptional MocR family regulator
MTPFITKDKLQQLLKQGLSQREMARRTGIPRSTLRQRMHPLGTREVHTGVRKPSSEQRPEGQLPQELMEAWEDLKEMQAWWRARKRALQTKHSHQETQRQTYHVEKRYIEAITRAADAEGVSITNMVNRAFQQYFCEGGIPVAAHNAKRVDPQTSSISAHIHCK